MWLFTILATCVAIIHAQQNQVQITLNSKFNSAGYASEISEFLANHYSNQHLFEYLLQLDGKLNHDQSPAEQYDILLKTAKQVAQLDVSAVELLQYSLASRYHSAKITATSNIGSQLKIAASPENGFCSTFIQFTDTNTACLDQVDDLDQQLEHHKFYGVSIKIPNEHIFSPENEKKGLMILYGLPEEEKFLAALQKLVEKTKNSELNFAVRFYVPNDPNLDSLRLTGYGIEMAIKSTEYKAVDDSKKEDEKNEADANAKITFPSEEVEGIDFNALAAAFPNEDMEKLKKFREHLVDSGNDLTPLKAWQLQDLAYQSVSHADEEDEANAGEEVTENDSKFIRKLEKLENLSQNFPSRVKKLAKTNVGNKLRYQLEKNGSVFANFFWGS